MADSQKAERADKRRATVADVPCVSCQHGYGQPHACEAPDYCACDQWRDLHIPPVRSTSPTPGGAL